MEGVELELSNIKRMRNDLEKVKLEKKTKILQIVEQNAILQKSPSDLQSWAKCKTLIEKQSDRLKALVDALKHQEKKQINFTNIVIARVLCISWTKPIKGSIFLPQMAAYMQEQTLDFSDIHQALKEVLCMFSRGKDPLRDISSGHEDSLNNQASPLLNLMGASSSCQLPMIRGDNSSEPSFTYLLNCYSRIEIEERNHGKQFSVPLLSDILTSLKKLCVQYSSLVLQGLIGIFQAGIIPHCTIHFFNRILSQNLPRGYLRELVARTYMNPDIFHKIFNPVLQCLYVTIQQANWYDNTQRRPMEALSELIEIRCGPNNDIHPICRLITTEAQFLPDIMSSAAGRELSRISLLGPFLSALVSAEVQPKLLEEFFNENPITNKSMTLKRQQKLENTRMSLHRMFDTILANSSCRDATLAYLATLLCRNEKRAQIQTEDNPSLTEDGFMLNLLSILQMLSVKIKLNTVDPLYPFHPSNFIEIKNDTRLKLTSQEVAEWHKHLDSTHKWTKPKFPTQCWFLTLHCHYIVLLPALQNYRIKLYATEDLQRMLDELQATESQWKDGPLAEHNKDLIKQWKQQLKQLVTFKLYAEIVLIGPIFLRRCLRFYISVAKFLLSLLRQFAPDNLLSELPLSQETMFIAKFTALPEWYVEDIMEFLLFIFEFCPTCVCNVSMDISPLITLLLVVVCMPHCIRNPHLITKIIRVLYEVQLEVCTQGTETFAHKFIRHPLSMTYLASCLMKFYTNVEIININSEFEDKFIVCYHISVILKSLWLRPFHRASIVKTSINGKHFVKFINILMNDITFLLEEILKHLKYILQLEEFTSTWNAISQEQQQSILTRLVEKEEQIIFFLKLAKEIVAMFYYLTIDIKEPFLRPELVGRLCTILNFNLQQLCGSKYKYLRKLEKYGWQPKKLFSQLIDIYLHLDCDNFAAALANDERDPALKLQRKLRVS